MKKLLFLLFITVIIFSAFPVIAASDMVIIQPSKTLEANSGYICGDFFEDVPHNILPSFIHLIITDINTKVNYDIPFYRAHRYEFYQLSPGTYKISSFELRIPLVNDANNKSFMAKMGFNYSTKNVNLKVNSELLQQFEVKAAESLYIGDYSVSFVHAGFMPYYGECRTAKINLFNHYDKVNQEFQKKKQNLQSVFATIDIQEVQSTSPVYKSSANEKAYLAGRLAILDDSRGHFDLYLLNLATKKRYTIEFSKKSSLQYTEVVPGEYYIETITYEGTKYDGLIPDELLLPFEITPKEVLYIGGIGVQVKKGWGNSTINSMFLYDFEQQKGQLNDDFKDKQCIIKGIKEE